MHSYLKARITHIGIVPVCSYDIILNLSEDFKSISLRMAEILFPGQLNASANGCKKFPLENWRVHIKWCNFVIADAHYWLTQFPAVADEIVNKLGG